MTATRTSTENRQERMAACAYRMAAMPTMTLRW
jgi:hypothetical protein